MTDLSDMVSVYRSMDATKKAARADLAVPCPECVRLLPRANPTKLLPGHTCRVHRYTDPRPESVMNDWYAKHVGGDK